MSLSHTALAAAEAGASFADEYYETSVAVDTKDSRLDYVTEADTGAQRRVIDRIRETYPDATVVGEEEDELKSIPDHGDAWVVDPVDGTTNFVHEIPAWTTSVAVVRDGEPRAAATVAPALDIVFRADADRVTRNGRLMRVSEKPDPETFVVAPVLRYGPGRDDQFGDLMSALIAGFGDLRRFGSAQLTLALVAAGSLDAAASAQPRPRAWDTVAGVHLVERAGGTVTDVDGNAWDPDSEGLIATNGVAHDRVLDVVRAAVA